MCYWSVAAAFTFHKEFCSLLAMSRETTRVIQLEQTYEKQQALSTWHSHGISQVSFLGTSSSQDSWTQQDLGRFGGWEWSEGSFQEHITDMSWYTNAENLIINKILTDFYRICLAVCTGSGWDGAYFLIVAFTVLCFSLVAGKVLITHWCFGTAEQAQHQCCLSPFPSSVG